MRAILAVSKAKDLPSAKGRVIEIDSKQPLEQAFAVLVDNNILSAPVWDEESKMYLGFLDIRDLVAFAVFASKENEMIRDLHEIVNHATKLHSKTQDSITVTYLCLRNPFKAVQGEATLEEVCRILATGTHRVPVIGADGKVINIISQSSIIQFFTKNCGDDEFLKKTVGDLHIGSSPVISVLQTDTALKTFSKLDDSGRSGLAVVDADGVLVGNTSGSDIKLYLKHHETLKQSIIEFLNKIRRLYLNTRAPSFTCRSEDSLYHVIGKLGATKAHRLFIVDDSYKPLKVVSLTDIIRVILKHHD